MSVFLFYVTLVLGFNYSALCRKHQDILNTCFDTKFHKLTPVPEPQLHGQCSPWKARACCESNSTLAFHQSDTWVGLTWNHCPGHTLSQACRNWFLKDLCFYECSPNTGPWITDHKIRIRNERYLNAPLCSSQCNGWWEACKNEYTCLANWGRGFNWTTGVNTCPQGAPCQSFRQMFNDNATIFCNKIWDFSWRVVPDTQHCLKINFTGANPNDAVARYYANTNAARKDTFRAHAIVLFLASVVAYFA